jgi:hypothetical protein
MADAVNPNRIGRAFDRAALERLADWLAVAVVITLPWSTSISQILIVAWLGVLVPTLDVAMVRRELQSPAGALPVLLWLLALVGVLWAGASGNVSWAERIAGLGGFHKLLIIPVVAGAVPPLAARLVRTLWIRRVLRGAADRLGHRLAAAVPRDGAPVRRSGQGLHRAEH